MKCGLGRWLLTRALPATAVAALSGCATVDVQTQPQTRSYLGFLRVQVPSSVGKIKAVEVKALGFGWERGPFLGWKSENWVIADPRECQMVIIIRSPAQAVNAARVIDALGGQDVCITDYTENSRR